MSAAGVGPEDALSLAAERRASIERALQAWLSRSGPYRALHIEGPRGSGKSRLVRLFGLGLEADVGIDGADSARRQLGLQGLSEGIDVARAAHRPITVMVDVEECVTELDLLDRLVLASAARLGFCRASRIVVEVEVAIERKGHRDALEVACREVLQRGWSEVRAEPDPIASLRRVLAETSWARALPPPVPGFLSGAPPRKSSTKDAADLVASMMASSAEGRTLCLALDGLSDAVPAASVRALIGHLGQRLRGKLLVIVARARPAVSRREAPASAAHPPTRLELEWSDVAEIVAAAGARLPEQLVRAGVEAIETLAARAERKAPPAFHALAPDFERRSPPVVAFAQLYRHLVPFMDPEVTDAISLSRDHSERALGLLRTVAVLELGSSPVDAETIAGSLGESPTESVRLGLEELADAGRLRRHHGRGYRIQTERGRRWEAARAELEVTSDETSSIVRDSLAAWLDQSEPPAMSGQPVRYRAKYADGRRAHDEPLFDRGDAIPLDLDFRHLPLYRRGEAEWRRRSTRGPLAQRLIWVAEGDVQRIRDLTVELGRSRRMLARYAPVGSPLARPDAELFEAEQERERELCARVHEAVAETFIEGRFYFRGEPFAPSGEVGGGFGGVLRAAAVRVIPELLGRVAQVAASPHGPPESGGEPESVATVVMPAGRMVSSSEELSAVLDELARRVEAQLAKGLRVKLG